MNENVSHKPSQTWRCISWDQFVMSEHCMKIEQTKLLWMFVLVLWKQKTKDFYIPVQWNKWWNTKPNIVPLPHHSTILIEKKRARVILEARFWGTTGCLHQLPLLLHQNSAFLLHTHSFMEAMICEGFFDRLLATFRGWLCVIRLVYLYHKFAAF